MYQSFAVIWLQNIKVNSTGFEPPALAFRVRWVRVRVRSESEPPTLGLEVSVLTHWAIQGPDGSCDLSFLLLFFAMTVLHFVISPLSPAGWSDIDTVSYLQSSSAVNSSTAPTGWLKLECWVHLTSRRWMEEGHREWRKWTADETCLHADTTVIHHFLGTESLQTHVPDEKRNNKMDFKAALDEEKTYKIKLMIAILLSDPFQCCSWGI